MQWGYRTGTGSKPVPLSLPISSYCHALITGASNSGKSYYILYALGKLLQDTPEIEVYFCDFKKSEDFTFLKGYPYYYSGNECYEGVMKYYESFCNARQEGHNKKRHLLVCDEYPAMINYLATQDKINKSKRSVDILGAVAEILMLGRGIANGIWIVTQRADANLFANGARDNFMVVIGLGRMSKEQKSMIFSGEEIPTKVQKQGTGYILADGHPLYEISCPRIRNIVDWKKHIKEVLMSK